MKILVVDDDEDVRNVLRQIVERHGNSVIEARDGQEGLGLAHKHKPDVIISDGLMPKMDGFQFLRAVKQDEMLRSVPFVFYTAIYTGDMDVELAFSLGADALIVKPKDPETFWKEFSDALEKHSWKKTPDVTGDLINKKDEERISNYCRIVAANLEEKVGGLENIIAELNRTAAALAESEARYRLLFEGNPRPMWVYDLETLAFLAVNNAAVLKYGYSREEFLSMTIKDILPPEHVPALLEKVSGTREGIDEAGIWKHRKKNGAILEVEITSHTLTFAGRKANLVMALDVTEQKRLDRLIENAANEWRGTFDAMSDAVALLDAEGVILRCNKAMARFLGGTFSEIIGRNGREAIPGATAAIINGPYEAAKHSRKRETLSMQHGNRWFDATIEPFFDEAGEIAGAVHILQDVTERKQLEDSLKAAIVQAEDEKAKTDSIIEAIGDGVTIQDTNFRILYQNQSQKNMIGDHIGELCYMAYEKRDQRCEGCAVALAFEDGKVHTVVRTAPTDKGLLSVEITASPLRDSKGNIIAGIEVVHDITERRKAEEAVEQQKRFAENLIQNSAIAMFVLDARHKVLIWNKACEELTGLPASEMLGTDFQWKAFYERKRPVLGDLVLDSATEELASLYQSFSRSVLMPEGLHAEGWYKNLNGKDRYIVFDAAPIHDNSGNVIAAIESLQDLTSRKKLEDDIIQSKQEWEETFNTITDMVTVHDKEYNIVRANKAAEKILGLSFLEPNKTKCFEYYHGTGCPPEGCPSCQSLVTGQPSTSEMFEPHLNMFIEIRAIPRFDSDGKIAGLIHVVRDITERKKAEASQERYSKQLTALNTASSTLLASTSLTDIYQEICNIIYSVFDLKMVWLGIINEGSFKVRPAAHAGQEDGYLSTIRVTWDDSPFGRGPTGVAVKTRKPAIIHMDDPLYEPWQAEAKKRGYASSMAVPLLSALGDCIGVLNFYGESETFSPDIMNLTQIFANQAAIAIENARLVEGLEEKVHERTKALEDANVELQTVNKEVERRREEADAASRSKTDFLANMSHELRTPLNAILGFSDIMLQGMAGPVSDKQKEFLNDIAASGNHLLALITDILDLSKIEAGKTELELGDFSVRELIASSLIMFKEKALKHSIRVETVVDETIAHITADHRKLKQVMVNLLSNAFKFTPDGGSVSVRARFAHGSQLMAHGKTDMSTELSAKSYEPDADFIEISVVDTGIGISRENQKKLFQPFQQVETSLTRKYSGTGLGLSLCRRFIELHNGSIRVESEPGRGSTFIFTIPMRS